MVLQASCRPQWWNLTVTCFWNGLNKFAPDGRKELRACLPREGPKHAANNPTFALAFRKFSDRGMVLKLHGSTDCHPLMYMDAKEIWEAVTEIHSNFSDSSHVLVEKEIWLSKQENGDVKNFISTKWSLFGKNPNDLASARKTGGCSCHCVPYQDNIKDQIIGCQPKPSVRGS